MTEPLVARLAQNDPSAMDEFYAAYRPTVFALARRLVGNDWDAEEVVQDVMWTIYRKADSFRGDSHFVRWIHRVTHNASLMLLRKRRRVPTPIENPSERLEQAGHPPRPTPDDLVIFQRIVRRLSDTLAGLDPVNQEVFARMDMEGRSKEEVAEALGLSVSALKSRLHRTRATLRDSLAHSAA